MIRPFKNIPAPEAIAAAASIAVGLLLLLVKFSAYFLTGSTAIFADAMEGIVNVVAAGFAAYSLAVAHAPADAKHPYGHGKIEFFSAGFEGGMILIAAMVAIGKAVETLVHRHAIHLDRIALGAVLMVVALALNGLLGTYLIRLGRARSSMTLEADGWHLITDAVTSLAALVALLIVRGTGWWWVDPVAAMLVSLQIGWTGLSLVRRSAAGLMDAQDFDDDEMLRRILDRHVGENGIDPKICSYHKLRHRHSGRYHWVDFHMMVPSWWDIEQGHRVASTIEYEIEQALGEGNATAHVEPCLTSGCGSCEANRAIAE